MTEQPELTAAQWKRRALRAENAIYHALWIRPLPAHSNGRPAETPAELVQRLRTDTELLWPDLIVREQHQPIEVADLADECTCDTDADDWDENHHERDDHDNLLCSLTILGHVCESCKDEAGDGPSWHPHGVLWPCPPVVALDETQPVWRKQPPMDPVHILGVQPANATAP